MMGAWLLLDWLADAIDTMEPTGMRGSGFRGEWACASSGSLTSTKLF
jgi:hypothetical protein